MCLDQLLTNISRSLLLGVCLMAMSTLSAQEPYYSWKGMQIGVFVRSSAFTVDEQFNLKIGQFLQQGEDRSFVGDLNRELIIQMGELLCQEIQRVSQADTVYFLNGQPEMARGLQQGLNTRNMELSAAPQSIQGLDQIWVISPFHIGSRIHKSVYIRSNRMYTERIPVEVLQFEMHGYKPAELSYHRVEKVCFDRMQHRVGTRYMDLFERQSQFGQFLSDGFSQWWAQWEFREVSNCLND